jgi:Mn-dependent DtxR family transcriptional regulator
MRGGFATPLLAHTPLKGAWQMTQSTRSLSILSNYGLVLVYLAAHACTTQREVSDALGITERQVATIIKDLATAGLIQMQREGRCNRYTVNQDAHLRHPMFAHVALRDVLNVLVSQSRVSSAATDMERALGDTDAYQPGT